MSPGKIDEYISRLERELRRRGQDDPRILAEAREHLVDAVEEGRQRGLQVDEAEREALERFGAPGVVAAHVDEERNAMAGFSGALGRMWQRKWWILVPTALAAIITSVTSHYFLPARYRSQATIHVVPQRVPENYIRPAVTTRIEDRLRTIGQQVRSRTRLERIIEDLDLYTDRRKTDTMQDIVEDMNDAIDIDIVQGDVFRVAFNSDNPRTARNVTERLTSFFIDESLKDRTLLAEGTTEFLENQIHDMRRKIIEYERTLKELKATSGGDPLSQADLLPYAVLQETYKQLLVKALESQLAANVERRQIGEQFRVLEPARLPESPYTPNIPRVTLIGALIGLLIGLALAVLRRSSNGAPPALAEA